jgi:hypothetical protein
MKYLLIFLIAIIIFSVYISRNKETFQDPILTNTNPLIGLSNFGACNKPIDGTTGEYDFTTYCEEYGQNVLSNLPQGLNLNNLETIIAKDKFDLYNGFHTDLSKIHYGSYTGGNYLIANKDSSGVGDIGGRVSTINDCIQNPPNNALGFSWQQSSSGCWFKNKLQLQTKQGVNTIIFGRSVQYSIAFWLKIVDPMVPTAFNRILSIANTAENFRVPAIYVTPNSSLQFGTSTTINNVYNNPNIWQESFTADPSFTPIQEWHHIVFTIQGNQLILYIDGNAISTYSFQGYPLDANSYTDINDPLLLRVGRTGNSPDTGGIQISDLRWYQLALTPDYINYTLILSTTKPPSGNVADAIQITNDGNGSQLTLSYVQVFDITGRNITDNQVVWTSAPLTGSVSPSALSNPTNIGWWSGIGQVQSITIPFKMEATVGKAVLWIKSAKSWFSDPSKIPGFAGNINWKLKQIRVNLRNQDRQGNYSWGPIIQINDSMIQPWTQDDTNIYNSAVIDFSDGQSDLLPQTN